MSRQRCYGHRVRARFAFILVWAVLLPVVGMRSAEAAPVFQMPFKCGETWRAATRDGHGSKYANGYNAIDMNHDNGSAWERTRPVLASAGGTVITSARSVDASGRGYGNYVEVEHRDGWITLYAHMSERRVTVGSRVRKGTRVGTVGDSGAPGAVHLHYEQVRDGRVRPVRFAGQRIVYTETYNGNPYTSRNSCPS